jgi:hypothetical protein
MGVEMALVSVAMTLTRVEMALITTGEPRDAGQVAVFPIRLGQIHPNHLKTTERKR